MIMAAIFRRGGGMRRKDRECNDPHFFDQVFSHAPEIFLALNNGDYPYILPLNFARSGSVVYFHSAREGAKLDLIRANGNAAFSLACDVVVDPENSTTCYKSICGRGKARIVEDRDEKRAALDLLALRYCALCQRPAPDADLNRVAIIRLDIESMTGKQRLPKKNGNLQGGTGATEE